MGNINNNLYFKRTVLRFLSLLFIFLYQEDFLFSKEKEGINQYTITEILRVKTGSGLDNIGLITTSEANPEGPMSFFVNNNEEIYILDQINSRIQVFKDKKRIKTIPLPSKSFIDIDLTPEGNIALLDNYDKKAIFVIDSEGKIINTAQLEGSKIYWPGYVTEIYTIYNHDKYSGIWAYLGDRSVRLASLDGTPYGDRLSVSGNLSVDGKNQLRAEKIGDATIVVYRSKDMSKNWDEFKIFLNTFIDHIITVNNDSKGRIYIGLYSPDIPYNRNLVVILDEEGKEIAQVKLVFQKKPHEIKRSLRINPDGHIYQMLLDDKDIVIKKYDWKGR